MKAEWGAEGLALGYYINEIVNVYTIRLDQDEFSTPLVDGKY